MKEIENASAGTIIEADDSGNLQAASIEILEGEVKQGVERIQEFGFTSVPLVDSEAVTLNFSGKKERQIIIATDSSEHRIKLDKGEAGIYSSGGNFIKMKKDGSIEIEGTDVKINCTNFEVNATSVDFKQSLGG